MIKIIILVLALASFQLSFFSQDSIQKSTEKRKFQFTDFSFSAGFSGVNNSKLSLQTYQSLVPESSILNKDLSLYNFGNSLFSSSYNNFRIKTPFNLLVGLKLSDPANSSKMDFSIRAGLTINKFSNNTTYGNKSNTINYATDTNSLDITYYDSIKNDNIYMYFSGTYIQFDGAILLKTKSNSKFSFHTGLGFNSGTVFNSYVNIYETQSIMLSIMTTNSRSTIYRESNSKNETYEIKKGSYTQIYIPVGFNYRLSKKNEFLQKVELFSEMRPNISFIKIAHLNTQINLSNSILFGCRITW
jgi:hypothetical protein